MSIREKCFQNEQRCMHIQNVSVAASLGNDAVEYGDICRIQLLLPTLVASTQMEH